MINHVRRKAAVQAVIDHKIRIMGGDNRVVDACVRVGVLALEYGNSGCRAIEKAVSAGAEIIDGGATC